MKISHRKGLSMEEEFGIDKAIEIKNKIKNTVKKSMEKYIKNYIYNCSYCNKNFIKKIKFKHLQNNLNIFCSRKCYYTAMSDKRFNYNNGFKANHPCYLTPQSILIISEKMRGHVGFNKGRTYEEVYGIEKSTKIKEKQSFKLKGKEAIMKNKTYDEVFGTEKALIIRKKISSHHQGIDINKWTKFTSLEPYSIEFINSFKEKIRERDNFTCCLCGINEKILNRKLIIHHIDYNKQNTCFNNCISLCRFCHAKTNYNRNKYMNILNNIQNKRGV